jgi:protein translocase SEC61 complex gamma subunit
MYEAMFIAQISCFEAISNGYTKIHIIPCLIYLSMLSRLEEKIRETYNTLMLTKKPDREEYGIHVRLLLLGLGVVGVLAFIIQLTATFIKLSGGP